jgi:hypothetical protein
MAANKQQPDFNKSCALDETIRIMQVPPGAPISQTLKALADCANYLQKIHDDAFRLGFEAACDAKKKIDEI